MAALMMAPGAAIIVPALKDDEEIVIACLRWTQPGKVLKTKMAASKIKLMAKQLRKMSLKDQVKATVQLAWRWPRAWLQLRLFMVLQDHQAKDNRVHKAHRALAKAKAAAAKAKAAIAPPAIIVAAPLQAAAPGNLVAAPLAAGNIRKVLRTKSAAALLLL
jgi:hypothetical protein